MLRIFVNPELGRKWKERLWLDLTYWPGKFLKRRKAPMKNLRIPDPRAENWAYIQNMKLEH
jgi:hypothetical protein